jgi:hypothetical protein
VVILGGFAFHKHSHGKEPAIAGRAQPSTVTRNRTFTIHEEDQPPLVEEKGGAGGKIRSRTKSVVATFNAVQYTIPIASDDEIAETHTGEAHDQGSNSEEPPRLPTKPGAENSPGGHLNVAAGSGANVQLHQDGQNFHVALAQGFHVPLAAAAGGIDNHEIYEAPDSHQPAKYEEWALAAADRLHATLDSIYASDCIDIERIGGRKLPMVIRREDIRVFEALGSGAFGEVWKAELDLSSAGGVSGYPVAVKMVKEKASAKESAELLKEAALMAQFSGSAAGHPNVISLVGLVDDGSGPIMAVIAYCEHGSLESYLKAHGSALGGEFQAKMGKQVAAAMVFIAGRGVVHRDLAARNVLLDSGRSARVSDFGMARDSGALPTDGDEDPVYAVYEVTDSANARFPVRWTAPECFESLRFTAASDVWSYGMFLVEVYTNGGKPYAHAATSAVPALAATGALPDQPPACPSNVYKLMQGCWSLDPKQRPAFASIAAELAMFGDVPATTIQVGPNGGGGGGESGQSVCDSEGLGHQMPVARPGGGCWGDSTTDTNYATTAGDPHAIYNPPNAQNSDDGHYATTAGNPHSTYA